jgi:hypothetical protein
MIPKWSFDVCGVCDCRSYTCTSTAQIRRRHLQQSSNKNSLRALAEIEQIENGERKMKWGAKKSRSNWLQTKEEDEIEMGEGD